MQMDNGANLFTIGHSNHELDRFLKLVKAADVSAIADVRSRPYSGRHPQYNRSELELSLPEHGIAYVYLGHELGGRPEDTDLYDEDGRVDYERVRRTYLFQEGLDRLARGLERYCIALFCAEEDPLDCHRGLMITPALIERGVSPLHLRGDGTTETTVALEDRLLRETRLESPLFADDPDERRHLLNQAYQVMAARKAFRQPREAREPS